MTRVGVIGGHCLLIGEILKRERCAHEEGGFLRVLKAAGRGAAATGAAGNLYRALAAGNSRRGRGRATGRAA